MAGNDSAPISAARADVQRAITGFIKALHQERINATDENLPATEINNLLVVNFAVYAEYTTPIMMDAEQSAMGIIVPDDQSSATSRGCFELGVDAFRRG